MLPARQPVRAVAAMSVAGALVLALWSTIPARAQACAEAAGIAVLPSPAEPWKGAPLRVLFVSEKPLAGDLALIGPDGRAAATSRKRFGGPPYFWVAEVPAPAPGTWQARLTAERAPAGCASITREIAVRASAPPPPRATAGSVWPIRASWDRKAENLYSAWIEKLFDAPLEETLSWKALHEVLRDPSRNILHDHLGLREDRMNMVVRPDCADLPYFLRAYFAFKMGLPFGYAKCTRGGGGQPPRCVSWWNIQNEEPRSVPTPEAEDAVAGGPGTRTASAGPLELFNRPAARPAPAAPTGKRRGPPARPANLALAFGYYLQFSIADSVHSGAGRTRLTDDNTDLYPVALNAESLRPGTVYADPYGHLLVLVKRVPQTPDSAGVILAVDAQPDGTVSRKRFWRGNFLFAQDPALGGPGFKRFRPIVRTENGGLRRLTNAEIARHPEYGDVSLEQGKLSVEDFYDRMEDIMSPAPLDPVRAMTEAITSLEEQVRARVVSVENGRKWQASARGDASMPDGAAIFETVGAWEDFATPSRDLRLLIALDVVRFFPDRVQRRPERYAMPQGKSPAAVKAELERVLAAELAARKFSYTRSDGSQWTLSLQDVIDRAKALEMAYNLNDCVELRWGAPEGSEEAKTCKRRAPQAQRAKMASYRAWFAERRRPPRG